MDFMKVFDQTVREIKREVNLKVLKVPEIEQKVIQFIWCVDATDDAPWGPHGTALAEIAQAANKFTECQMVMNVLWTRLGEKGKDWRLVYKALSVIEYLVAHGSERAVDDIIEHTFQISLLYAAIFRYFGLSSTGITCKSGAASYGSSGFQSSSQYGSISGTRNGDSFRDSYRDRDHYRDEKTEKDNYDKSHQGDVTDDPGNMRKKCFTRVGSRDQNNVSVNASKLSSKLNDPHKNNYVPSQCSSAPSSNYDDDFDPRGTSSSKPAAETSNQVFLFGENLIGDLVDAPTSVSTETSANGNSSEVDLFADATFVSAPPQVEKGATSHFQTHVDLFATQPVVPTQVDLFASQPVVPPAVPQTVDFFSTVDPVVQPDTKAQKSDSTNNNIVDPFVTVPLNNFDGSDLFGASSSSNSVSTKPEKDPINDGSLNTLNLNASDSKPLPKETFQVKSGIWADSLSRGLIDLNISAHEYIFIR
ncbi:hypothetical protein GH714_030843 [Hevea brasiliensis]|uniref:ENTH domain-containing protein n=1 Tax=Hevea brasiliensis TaxID=3981 RepID=A0A6A6LV77_HEVBR|nr:hypothetical protein GH714_030843 [Hevea brasiliensis]